MPAIGNIVINDGAATPVAHTFSPTKIDSNNVAVFHDRSGGIAIGYPQLSAVTKLPDAARSGQASGANRVIRNNFKVDVPTLEVTSPSTGSGIQPAPTLSYVNGVDINFRIAERATLQERKNILAYARNLLAHATIIAMVENSEVVF